jgi:hypothetical protein
MSIQVKHFDDAGAEKALKNCPKLVRDYVKKLKESNKQWQKISGQAVKKMRDINENNDVLHGVSNNEVTVCVNCDKEKETHSICMECLTKIINENKQTDC